jgi:hypothetical protein
MSHLCKDKTDEEMTAFCGICNERGHPACMVDMPNTIQLHPEQHKGVKIFGLIRKKCEDLLLRLNQQAHLLENVSDEATAPTLSASSGGGHEGRSFASASLPPPENRARMRGGGRGGKSLTRGRGRGGNPGKKPRLQ